MLFTTSLLNIGVFSAIALAAPYNKTKGSELPYKFMPTDSGWPSLAKWQHLNQTINGRLIQTIPLPSVCHLQPFGLFSQEKCSKMQSEWTEDIFFIDNPAEVMNPYFQNQTCDPFTSSTQPCELGNYASYSIEVTGAEDVIAGIKFVQDNNIRLVIKNTGHDFSGKSTGAGSLSLWTHNMNTTTIIPSYKSNTYKGPAAKLGAGVVAGQVYETVGNAGYRILGGTCPTVGLAGGYTSGGGHGLLNSQYGMAADAVLEWEVVTAQGQHIIASETENSDLYWALSGGGAGTFGVILSMTTKIFPDGPIGSGNLTFSASPNEDKFWKGMGAFFEYMPKFVDAGPNTFDIAITAGGMQTVAITVPDKTAAEVSALLQPLFDAFKSLDIAYDFTPSVQPSYLEHVQELIGPLPWGFYPANVQLTSRFIPRSLVLDSSKNQAIMDAMRAFFDNEYSGYWTIGCHVLNVKDIKHPDNAVFPNWRDAIASCNIESIWDWNMTWPETETRKELLIDTLIPGLEQATAGTSGSGIYLNEIDAQWEGNFQEEFYGTNYPRLLEMKNKYDPGHTFYAKGAVGSEYWFIDGSGRLRKAN